MGRNTWTAHLMRALLYSAALTLTACGSDGGGPVIPQQQMIGPAGGTATGPNGAQVVVPAGALAADTAVAVTASSGSNPALPAGLTTVGPVYAFTPHGQSFAQAVTVTVPIDPAQAPAGAAVKLFKTMNGAAGPWQEVVGATRTGNLISGQVTGFSLFAAVTPFISQQPADQSVIAPAPASFSVTALGAPPFAYRWERSDDGGTMFVAAGGVNNTSTYTTAATSVAADNGARYRVIVANDTNANGLIDAAETSTQSNVATLTVTAAVVAPTITTQPQSVSGATGNVTFSVVATGTNLVYQWFRNGVAIAGATNASLNLVNVQASDAGNYTVVVSNLVNGVPVNSVTSNVATLTVTTPPAATAAARIAAGSDFSLARRANGELYSWGSDSAGTLGAGNGDQSRNVPGLALVTNVSTVATGGAHGLAVVGSSGGIRGWGYNGFGQLGDGSNLSRETPVNPPFNYPDAVEVCGGSLHSLIRRSNGVVSAMGANLFGQLGDGTNTDSTAAPYSVVVTGITNAVAIACRGNHSLALLADGTVRAWGINTAGQLGDGTTVNRNAPVVVSGLSNVIAIAAGTDHSLALRNDGSVWAWGSNVNGKLGDGTTINRPTPTATLLTSGITAIAAGHMNSVALRNDGVALTWGINETGQLGSGSLSPGFRPQPAPVTALTDVVAIAMGTGGLSHALAVRSDGTVWAWGDNMMGTDNNGNPRFGKLGNGSTLPFSATPVQVTGLNLN